MKEKSSSGRIPAIRFRQWLEEWDSYDYEPTAYRKKPEPYIYLFAMKAADLRRLSDVYRRERQGRHAEGIQRARDDSRTGRIKRYVKFGYPYGDIKEVQRTEETLSLRKPGWLPTSIVINILNEGDTRRNRTIRKNHVAKIAKKSENIFEIIIPQINSNSNVPLPPFEVIDGQHRLWAFDELSLDEVLPDDFELPVVAFHGLDVAWQAYLFWSINVSPKRINPSHAFDLYPLLRTQDWLERIGEITVYREARAQELVEWMYTHELSPWRDRINMLGSKGGGVSQAAWVRGLLGSYLGTGRGTGRYGLFQANIKETSEPLQWTRAQQAAFLIFLWNSVKKEINSAKNIDWISQYRTRDQDAFEARSSMLNQDMGVRAFLAVSNDIFYSYADEWDLINWLSESSDEADTNETEISIAINSLKNIPFYSKITSLASALAKFDWRSVEGPNVKENRNLEMAKRAYRGSGGYTVLTHDLLSSISNENLEIAEYAAKLIQRNS